LGGAAPRRPCYPATRDGLFAVESPHRGHRAKAAFVPRSRASWSDRVEAVGAFPEVTGNEGRAKVSAAAEHYADVMNSSRHRSFPIAVAAFLLGTVMVAFAARAMSGRKGGRGGLVQVVSVQIALIVASYFLTTEMRKAETDLHLTVQIEGLREAQPAKPESEEVIAMMQRFVRVAPPVFLSAQVLLRLLILLALTRPRTREFFAAAEERSLEG